MIPVRGRVAYPAALVAGVVFAVWLLGWHDIVPADVLHAASDGDEAISIVGQRYFLAEPWGWPLLRIARLDWPGGVNAALTDSIPLALLAIKPVRFLLAPGASVSEAWFALVLALQPVAAVFALRGFGERRAVPALAVALLALSMPTLLHRAGHMALCSHAVILCAVGLYVRLSAPSRTATWPEAAALLVASLLIHPYIVALVAAVLAAVPLTLLLRRDPAWRRAAALYLACLALCAALAAVLGFGGSRPAPGFGFYSMNLLAPLLPAGSALFPDMTFAQAGGAEWEGYQYLGAGILLLFAVSLVQAARGRAGGWRRHGGLLLVLPALCVFALSNDAYAGPFHLYAWGPVPPAIEQFRATARFFWPVAYVILVGGVAAAATLPPGPAMGLLAAAMALQWADTAGLRTTLRQLEAARSDWAIDASALRPVLARHDDLTLWPSFGCGAAADHPADAQMLLLASETLMRTNTMGTARDRAEATCDAARTLAEPLRPGELRVLTHRGDAWLVPDAARMCRVIDPYVLCSADTDALIGLAALPEPSLAPGQTVHDPAFRDLLAQGWSVPDGGGVWSEGSLAVLRLRVPPGPARLTVTLHGLAPEPGGAQHVQVTVDGAVRAAWTLPDLASVTHTIALTPCAAAPCQVELHVARPTRPDDRGLNKDTRRLGVYLESVRLDVE